MIKKLSLFSTFLLVGFLSLASSAAAEKIDSFDISAEIGRDGTVSVTEYIKYNFENAERHGIYRNVPLKSKDGPDIAIEVLGVSDDSGDVPFNVTRSGGVLNIKIGDAEKFVSGVVNYRIDYQVFGSIRFFENNDEFYWNVTGNEWEVMIVSASAEVFADFGFLNSVSPSCYTGPIGSMLRNCRFVTNEDKKSVAFSVIGSLPAGDGFTFAVSIPKGEIDPVLAEKGFKENDHSISILWFWMIFIPAIFIFISFFVAIIISSTKKLIGDKRLKSRPIVAQYNPPEELSVAEMAFVGHRDFRASDISPVIIKLAMDGFIKIIYPKDAFFTNDNYELVKLKAGTSIEDGTAKKIFEYLFFAGKDSVKINDLDRKEGAKLLRDLGTFVSADLLNKGVFEKKNWLSTRLSGVGVDLLWKLFGFSMFLTATEKEKLELLNAPELKPDIFEKFLPYAMVLGIEKKWAKKFEHIFMTPPSWVDGYPANKSFNALVFVNSMNSFNRSIVSHSTYSSGGGGGGSSGGGSGGGGGGSW